MNYKKKVLKNGLRIVAVPIKGAPSVTVMSLVETGSEYEDKKNDLGSDSVDFGSDDEDIGSEEEVSI